MTLVDAMALENYPGLNQLLNVLDVFGVPRTAMLELVVALELREDQLKRFSDWFKGEPATYEEILESLRKHYPDAENMEDLSCPTSPTFCIRRPCRSALARRWNWPTSRSKTTPNASWLRSCGSCRRRPENGASRPRRRFGELRNRVPSTTILSTRATVDPAKTETRRGRWRQRAIRPRKSRGTP